MRTLGYQGAPSFVLSVWVGAGKVERGVQVPRDTGKPLVVVAEHITPSMRGHGPISMIDGPHCASCLLSG